MRSLRQDTSIYGAYAQESLRIGSRWTVDLGARLDRIRFGVTGQEWLDYDWSRGRYVQGTGPVDLGDTYTAISPRVGLVCKLGAALHAYASASAGTQTPTSDELSTNPQLQLMKVASYELGLKLRRPGLDLDAAAYYSPLRDEVVQVVQSQGETDYANAGRTRKRGVELSADWRPFKGAAAGGSYTWSNFTFEEFSEPAFGRNVDRSGNALPYVPRHYYSLFAGYEHRSGGYVRASANTWGRYWMDNANSERYAGYRFVTDLALGYRARHVELALVVQNLFDQRYAVEVQKDLYGALRYSPASPRYALARVSYRF
jgi:iron complex outermembrane receptor protein